MSHTLRFKPGGQIDCLYTEAIPLRVLGRLQVFRATDIRFCERTQLWIVRCAATGKRLHSDPSRETCLAWERDNLGPPNPEVPRPANTYPPLTGQV
ncbi:MAG: hypothetical protein K9N23_20300 [Akkermansiaceae bacterium]|nr:hypothetical protein [Akkermansiaceae bacterium]